MTAGSLATRLASLRARVESACARAGRDPGDVRLLAVSKTQDARAVADAAALGLGPFGENYVQEWLGKADDPRLAGLRWHFIGRLQRNKVRFVVGRVDCIESVDSLALAQAISERASARAARQGVLLQVNLAGEASKAGFAPAALQAAWPALAALPGLQIDGLMHVPPPRDRAEECRADHRALRALRDALPGPLPVLSMGMSDDLEVAIEEGATEIRVGSALFGPRA